MCAGLSFDIDIINPDELDHFFLPAEYDKHRRGDRVEVFFWDRKPFLPVEEDDGVHLYSWGNREKDVKMPKTGWAKLESIQDGRWDWLAPKIVKIPSLSGCEKKKWFKTPAGIKGLKVRYHNIIRVYLITQKANQNFQTKIGHDRMPISH
ncbi:hypothetical protein COT97_00975 [Candidatus Falkowbacteria bacterium CG10_big_fil_rev_8_21_14_0_10_39_11]|uniref:Uncharacterized protein n=1 Tax=Candidatus Falkowbacteria bacterium CG10_big_fil_rev_8_21_14_0_10_39_11 TaxID=1974565 RepID=A0A2H0V612_9BACT|nr:MAG: hypothetical protein COT97_00975 [Candidatus Falkowbacteria bacterium CG10_big_fil_rev_8_21_14_0_10_39_11]